MGVFVEKTINYRRFLFIVGERDEKTGEFITGVVLRGTDDPENEDFQRALYIAYDTSAVLTSLSYCLSVGMSPRFSDLKQWANSDLIDFSYNAYYVFAQQSLWDVTDDEKKILENAIAAIDKELWRRSLPKPEKLSPAGTYGGFVYLLQSPTGAYKIGRTRDPKNRLKTFEIKLPFEVSFICTIQTTDMYRLEHDLHVRFAGKRVNGEWFVLEVEDIEYIKGLAT